MTANPILPLEHTLLLLAAMSTGALCLAWRASLHLPPRLRFGALAARAAAWFALAAIALNFGEWRTPDAELKPRWCVLVDRSASMATADVGGRSRWAAACAAAARVTKAAPDRRDTDLLVFSDQLDVACPDVTSLAEETPDGRATDAGRAVAAVASAGGARPIGIVLLTDGRQTGAEADPVQAGMRARAQDTPVLAVSLGQVKERRDLSVKAARRLVIGFAGQPVRVQAEVASQWPTDVKVAVHLVDGAGKAVATNEVMLPAAGRAATTFSVTPLWPGYASFKLRIAPWEDESDVRNNESPFEVNALDKKIRVLLVEGVPYWDSKFLGQHLRNQANMEVTTVCRTAPERFFTIAPDGSSHADLKEIFPETAEKLAAYDIVVFGKGAEYLITPARIAALKTFVADQGGSVVFARGRPYAGQGGGLEDLEPVEWPNALPSDCRLVPLAEGEDVGLFAGHLPGRDDAVWSRLPLVKCSQGSVRLKSFAQVLAEGSRASAAGGAASSSVPLLISRRYGKGMAVTMNVDGLWQWSFFPSAKEAAGMYEDLWAQMLLWAGTYSEFLPGHQYAVRLSASTVLPNTPVRVQVRRRGSDVGREAPRLRGLRGNKLVQEMALAGGDRADRWESVLTLSDPGLYRILLNAPSEAAEGRELGVLLQVAAPPGELDDVNPDPDYLAKLAAASGGQVVSAAGLEAAMAQREQARASQREQGDRAIWEPLWDRGWLLVVVLAALAAEWTIRRRNGLA